jgi:hypothetical protein
MNKALGSFLIAIAFAGSAASQNLFEMVTTPITDMGNSQACWGDYDKDGDLDVVIAGESASSGAVTKIFRNDSGIFTEVDAVLPGVHFPSLDWGDYDRDGDLDLLLTGQDSLGIPITKIIRNKDGNFTVTGIQLPGIYSGQASWGDFDNDNDPDILLSGIGTDGFYTTKILRNDDGNTFTDIGAVMVGYQSASVCWVDYNNDGQLDACVSGDSGGGIFTKLYRNNNGSFSEVPFEFAGLGSGQIEWADLDNDGDADLLECGMDVNINGFIYIYRNDGNDQFTLIDGVTNTLISSASDIGDYDNDGLFDFMVIGVVPGCGSSAVTLLYHNEGDMVFSEVSTLLPGYKNGSVMWGDYNNDGWSDLLLTGYNSTNEYTSNVYRNLGGNAGFSVNTPPAIPGGLASAVDGNNATLSWNRATDAQTPANGLFYNVYIGTGPTTPDVVSPLADIYSGFPRVLSTGNAGQDTTLTFHGLPAGNYYWSVQALDNGYMGSVFPPVESFTITATGTDDRAMQYLSISPNPASDHVTVSLPGKGYSRVTILNAFGQIVHDVVSSSANLTFDISGISAGMYFVKAGDFSGKFIKK